MQEKEKKLGGYKHHTRILFKKTKPTKLKDQIHYKRAEIFQVKYTFVPNKSKKLFSETGGCN